MDLPEVTAARGFYGQLARDYLAGALDRWTGAHAVGSGNGLRSAACSTTPRATTGPGTRACCAGMCSAASATSRGCAPPGCSARASTRAMRRGLARRARRRCDADGSSCATGARGRAHRGRGLAHQPAAGRGRAAPHRPIPQRSGRLRPPALSQGRAARRARRRARRCRARSSPSRTGTGACSGPATPTSAGRCLHPWASGPARSPRGCSTRVESLPALWARVDRSPLGSAAGYGVPLPLQREVVARALGFAGLDRNVATVQGGRGKLEAAVLFWCTQLGHDARPARPGRDPLQRPRSSAICACRPSWRPGSSIMPHKRNPDLFELTRGRAAALEGDLARRAPDQGQALRRLPSRLPAAQGAADARARSHRGDARGRRPTRCRSSGVDRERCAAALAGGALATDEVMRRVEAGRPFRTAYREVAAALKAGRERSIRRRLAPIIARRRSHRRSRQPGLPELKPRDPAVARAGTPRAQQLQAFDAAMAGRPAPRPRRPADRPS